jgi:putative aldouronate transport system permease protein
VYLQETQVQIAANATLGKRIRRHRALYALVLPSVAYFIIFRYVPLWNAQIAFKDFQPLDGVLGSAWNGLVNFMTFFNSYYFVELIRNTLFYSFMKLLLGVPMAILLALTIYESKLPFLRKLVQTMTYLPHFLSWVIMYGLLLMLLSPGDGLLNDILKLFGMESVPFLTDPRTFPAVVILSDLWKEMGWSAIIFLAALIAIDPNLFEAADMEGANALQKIRYITLPGILDVIVVVVLLRLGTILDAGFHQIFVLYSYPVFSVADIIDTWVYRQGLLEFQFSLATAVGLFKGVIGMVLLVTSNRLIRKMSGSSLY